MSFYLKDPQSRVDYAIDWSSHLGGQTLTASQWAVSPDETGGVAVDEASFDPHRSAARLSGGIVGHIYRIGNRVTLSDDSVDERSITLRVEEK
jgi:hypothetical protein